MVELDARREVFEMEIDGGLKTDRSWKNFALAGWKLTRLVGVLASLKNTTKLEIKTN
jgi:hypothetical protein